MSLCFDGFYRCHPEPKNALHKIIYGNVKVVSKNKRKQQGLSRTVLTYIIALN